MRVKLTDGRVKDVNVTDVTPDNYIVPEGEEHLYHAIIEVKKFDSNNGNRLSVPRLQKFGKKMFDHVVHKNLMLQGYTITILHDPSKWMKEHEAQIKASNALKEQEQAKIKEEEEKAKREALKAEILKELKDSGVLVNEETKTKTNKSGK